MLLMISKERVRQLVASGHIPKVGRNTYSLVGAIRGYLRFKDEELRRVRDEASANGLRSVRQAEIEMRMAERRRDLISRAAAEAAMLSLVGFINEEFGGFAARVTRDRALRDQIDAELDLTINRVSDRCGEARGRLSKREEPRQ